MKDIKCDNCGRIFKTDIDYRYSIVGKYSKTELLLCIDCFINLKKEVSEMWVQM